MQLRNAINRRNVSAAAEDDYNSCDDFLILVVRCHIIAAAMEYFDMKAVSDKPSHPQLTDDLWLKSTDFRKDILCSITNEIVLMYVDIEPRFDNQSEECDEEIIDKAVDIDCDKVQLYACELLSNGLLYMEFADSVWEADGHRILHCWRYLMLVFKATHRSNYSIEALNLLSQFHFFLSPRQSQQLIWSRCINTHGIPGRNIAGDLYMEHLNKICKSAVANLCANKTSVALERAGKCVGVLSDLTATYDKELGISENFGTHSSPNTTKDMHMILQELLEENVFANLPNRKYHCTSLYNGIRRNIISTINSKALQKWMKEHLSVLRNTLY